MTKRKKTNKYFSFTVCFGLVQYTDQASAIENL